MDKATAVEVLSEYVNEGRVTLQLGNSCQRIIIAAFANGLDRNSQELGRVNEAFRTLTGRELDSFDPAAALMFAPFDSNIELALRNNKVFVPFDEDRCVMTQMTQRALATIGKVRSYDQALVLNGGKPSNVPSRVDRHAAAERAGVSNVIYN